MPIMFLEDLYSSRMYPGTQQVRDLKGKRFKRLGTFLSFCFFFFSPNCANLSRSYIESAEQSNNFHCLLMLP